MSISNLTRRYDRPCYLQNTHRHTQCKAKERQCKITQSSKRHAPLSFVLLSLFHSFSVVLFPHLSYLQTLQTRIPACNQDKKPDSCNETECKARVNAVKSMPSIQLRQNLNRNNYFPQKSFMHNLP